MTLRILATRRETFAGSWETFASAWRVWKIISKIM